VVTNLIEKEYANKLINALIPVIEDSAFRILNTEGRKLIDEFEEVCQLKTEGEKNLFVDDDLDAILNETILGEGLSWRLKSLNDTVGVLRGGTLGHIFARPDTGKTSFVASEITYLASQVQENECILWINNEEKGSKVKLRTYQAILNADTKSIVANIEKAKAMYIERGGGKIKLYDSAAVSFREIKKLIDLYRPKVVVIDQGDKVSFPKDGDYSNTDRLQRLYQMYRELAKRYDTNIITVGQASGEAEGKKWLTLDMMNNSKTGKPGELDYAIGIGLSYGEGDEEFRYIHVCKNKYGAHAKHTVIFDAEKSRYRDI